MRASLIILVIATIFLISCSQNIESSAESISDTNGNSVESAAYVTTDDFDEWVIQSELPVLVDFTAEWCVPCKVVDPIIDSLTAEFDGRAHVFKLDIDNSPEIYSEYKVNGIPHILFFNNGVEEERISSPQEREVYVDYLESMIRGDSAKSVTYSLLNQDAFRRHFILSRELDVLESAMVVKTDLLTKNFENGLTPLSLILNYPSVRQNELIDLALEQDPDIAAQDLVALGRCDEFQAAVLEDPEAVDRPDADGNIPILTAIMRAHRLGERNCVRTVLEAGPDLRNYNDSTRSLNRSVILLDDDDILNEFLKRGWNPAHLDDGGKNALHWAARYGEDTKIRTLLDFGMDPASKDSAGDTAGDIVKRYISRQEQRVDAEKANMDDEALQQFETELQSLRELVALLDQDASEQPQK